MEILEILGYIAGMLGTAGFWSFKDGQARREFNTHDRDFHPPYKLGIITSFVWPLQVLAAVFWAVVFVPSRVGEKRAITKDEELVALRKKNEKFAKEAARIYRQLDSGVDPTTKEGLLALSAGSVASEHAEADEDLENLRADDPAEADFEDEPEIQDRHGRTLDLGKGF